MCDELTEAETQVYLSRLQRETGDETATKGRDRPTLLSRRELQASAGAAFAVALAGCAPSASTASPSAVTSPKQMSTRSRMVSVPMPDGRADAFYVTPQQGRHPAVLLWPDVAGLRDAFQTMATQLAMEGYAVLCVNPYYRASPHPILDSFSEWQTESGKAKIAPMREALTPERVAGDGAAFVAWLDQQAEVDATRKVGTAGYCMSGAFALRTGARTPERVRVIASFHGGGLVTEDASSPHLLFDSVQGVALICIAENDDARQPEAKTVLYQAAQEAGVRAEVEVYPAQHGWCVRDSPVYDPPQAQRAWDSLLGALAEL